MEPADLTGVVLDGRYRVIEQIAQGAMGIVYRAERVKLGRIVAVKVLHESLPSELSSRRRFEIEAKAMAKLEHPHCAAVVDIGLHDDRPFVVMDFVSGQNLKDVIAAEAPLPAPRAAEILRQILSGLAHAHELGIIHRDIKPANIVLSQKAGLGDHVKILDFGLARLNQDSSLTTGMVVGTPSYMAPEQIRGMAIDGRVDLYACGIVLFELLTGDKPFVSEKDDPIEVCSLHLTRAVPRLADRRPELELGELEAVVARALAKSPDERYASAAEFTAALDVVPRRAPTTPVAGVPLVESAGPRRDSIPGLASGFSSLTGPAGPRPATPPAGARTLPMPGPGTPPPGMPPPGMPPPGPASEPGGTPLPDLVVQYAGPAASGGATAGATIPPAPEPLLPAPAPAAARVPKRRDLRRIALAGGGALVLLVVVIIAVAAGGGGGGGSTPAPADAAAVGTAPPGPPDRGGPADETVARANDLIAGGQKAAAIDLLVAARKIYPADARLPYLLGMLYFERLYWSEGMRMFREAIRLEPSYRTDPELIKTVLRGFITTPRADGALAAFLREDIGDGAKPFLEETAADHPNPMIRARAANELRRYR